MKHVNVRLKIIVRAKKVIVGTLAHALARIARHIVDNSVITCDETMYIIHIVSTNVSINCDDKKARYKVECYILQTVLLVIILPLIIAIICDLYVKHRPKPNKTYSRSKNIKMENSEFKKISIKIVRVIILMT